MKFHESQIKDVSQGRQPCFVDVISIDSGVYFLLNNNDEVLYVGQSKCILARLAQHWAENGMDFSKVAWLACAVEDRLCLEQRMIQKYRPRWNDPTLRRQDRAMLEKKLLEVAF